MSESADKPNNEQMAPLPDLNEARIAVIGLGYVGLPLAISLSRFWPVVGYDINSALVEGLQRGEDAAGELSQADLSENQPLRWTTQPTDLDSCNFFIVAVPTPISTHHYPDLGPLQSASSMIAGLIKPGSVVIYESTVYPGATEEICVPILEHQSGLKLNQDFFVGYSPERINPGDRQRRLEDIVKVTSGSSPEVAELIDRLYQRLIRAGTFRAASIRVAEAAKAIENTQRDLNIAFVNELAMMFERMGLDTEEVLAAASSKWNFLNFKPGLVGGHCIGVDPYYLIHKAQAHGYHPELILAARRINNRMASHVTNQLMRLMASNKINIVASRVLILGLAFKENCADLRNTQAAEIVSQLRQFNAEVDVYDPWVDPGQSEAEFGIDLLSSLANCKAAYDAVVIAVAHDQFRDMGAQGIRELTRPGGVVYDVKQMLPAQCSDGRL